MRLFAFLGLKQKVSHVDIAKNQPGKAAFLDPERVHKGRRPGVLVVQVNLDPEALGILRTYCPKGNKQLGEFVSRLLIDWRARDEERAKMRGEVLVG